MRCHFIVFQGVPVLPCTHKTHPCIVSYLAHRLEVFGSRPSCSAAGTPYSRKRLMAMTDQNRSGADCPRMFLLWILSGAYFDRSPVSGTRNGVVTNVHVRQTLAVLQACHCLL